MLRGRRLVTLAMVVVLAWYAATLVTWAARPLHDAVPVGVDRTLDPPRDVSQEVECNTLFGGSPRSAEPLPTLTEQPADTPMLQYSREPCELVQDQARLLFGLNTSAVVLVLAGLVWARRHQGAATERGATVPA